LLLFRPLFLLWPLLLTLATASPALAAEDAASALAVHLRARVEQLQQAVARNPDNADLRKAVLDAEQFYVKRNHAPAWNAAPRLDALIAAIDELVDDGLNPADYAVERLRELRTVSDPSTTALACRDILATHAYLAALSDLSLGRLTPPASEEITHVGVLTHPVDRDQLITAALDGLTDISAAFAHARPDSMRYQALRSSYAQLRPRIALTPWQPLPPGPSLHPEDSDVRVAMVRKHLQAAGYAIDASSQAPDSEEHYDTALAATVQRFQRAHHLDADGVIGPATLAALNMSPARRLDQLRVNLERTRWLAREMEDHLVLVDVAGAMLTYYRDAQPVWSTKTQVGRPSRPTPLIKSAITHFTFNPTWTVPPTILRKDKLPEIRRDITYLEKHRIRVLDHSGQELNPESIDWERPGAIMLRQDAGPENALGRVAIRFPNPHWVYLHDTPSQRLFEREQRNFSSGCVRVERAAELVELLLADGGGPDPRTIARIQDSGKTRNVNLDRPIPILTAYWTVDAAPDGTLSFRPDVYRRDAAVLQALSDKQPLHEIMATCD
jgi:murein L,D-transpeptidase YcbB/YkuD